VHAQAAPALGDVDERRQEVGQLSSQGGELVDDDDQSRQRVIGPAQVFAKVRCAHGAQPLLSITQLGLQTAQGASCEVLVKVSHDRHHVRQRCTQIECTASLEVDEHEVQVIRTGVGRHRSHERAEKFALARPGRSGDEPVRTVAHKIDVHGTNAG